MSQFREERIKQRKSFLEEKLSQEKRHESQVKKILAQCKNVENSLKFILNNEESIIGELSEYKELSSTEKLRIWEASPNIISAAIKTPNQKISEIIKYGLKQTKKEKAEFLSRIENSLSKYIISINSEIKNLFRLTELSNSFSKSKEYKTLAELLESFRKESDLSNFQQFPNFIAKLKENYSNFVDRAHNYIESIKDKKLDFNERKQQIISSNIKSLEMESEMLAKTETAKKQEYFNTLDGVLLGFCAYHLEAKNQTEDEKYLTFLEKKADEKLSLLKKYDEKEVENALQKLKEKHLSENEYIFLKLMFKKESESAANTPEESFEDMQLRAMRITDFGIPVEESLRIAKLTESRDIDERYMQLSTELKDLAPLIVKDNPEIFILDISQVREYIEIFKGVRGLTSGYQNIECFNPYKSPKNFSSFDALKRVKRQLHELIKEASAKRSAEEINEIASIKEQLRRDEFNPDLVWPILNRGFYFKGKIHAGNNKISIEHLIENTERDTEYFAIRKDFNKELKKLISRKAVIDNLGYSLNHRTKEIEYKSLRNAISYILRHNPLES